MQSCSSAGHLLGVQRYALAYSLHIACVLSINYHHVHGHARHIDLISL